jgi:hypothetical protein
MSSQPVDHQHPMVDFARRLHSRLDSLADVSLRSMGPSEKREVLLELTQSTAQLEMLRLRVLAETEQSEATGDSGAASAADWLAIESRTVRRDARSDLRLAEKLEGHEVLSAAIGRGQVNVAQARAIVAAPLDTGGRISASEARRLACRAGIIPMVLGGRGQVLDLGRKRRLHTEGMRVAMGVRDRGCTAEHCETPPGLCHAHHDIPWSGGGHTNIDTGRLLCPHHHRRVHDPRYQTTRLANGKIRFHRRE